MEYVPREPDHSVNVSKEHPLVEAGTLVVGLGIIFAVIAAALIFLIEIALFFVPAEKEAQMFSYWLPEDITTVAYDDPRLLKTDEVLQRLARHYPESPYEFRVEIDNSPQLNAMAFPGGLIVVTSGLIDKVDTENELAFVLGHEIGHYRNRDHLRAMGRGLVFSLMLLVISGDDSANYGATIADLTLKGASRRQESDADLFGLELVQSEYGHVAGSWRFFERIAETEDDEFLDLLDYTATHPSPDDRIETIIEIANRNNWPVEGAVTPIDWGPAE